MAWKTLHGLEWRGERDQQYVTHLTYLSLRRNRRNTKVAARKWRHTLGTRRRCCLFPEWVELGARRVWLAGQISIWSVWLATIWFVSWMCTYKSSGSWKFSLREMLLRWGLVLTLWVCVWGIAGSEDNLWRPSYGEVSVYKHTDTATPQLSPHCHGVAINCWMSGCQPASMINGSLEEAVHFTLTKQVSS